MLRQLGASDPGFKTLDFRPGLNLLVADVTPGSTDTDSRNGVGKSSFLELLHFLLGEATDRKALAHRPELRSVEFHLDMDWPGQVSGLRVTRSGERLQWVSVDPLPTGADYDVGTGYLRVTEWQRLIERDLFGLTGEHPGVSGRQLLSFLIRRASSGAFNSPTRSHSRQADAEATTNLAYLLGLDWQLASRYRTLQKRDAARKQMSQAAEDPLLGEVVGKASDLRGRIILAERRTKDLETQIANFRVVPEYENLRRTADQIDKRIRDLRNRDVADQRNLEDLERALADAHEPDVDYLEPTYRQAGVILGDQVRRRFTEVEQFHASVVRNRQRYLQQELEAVQQRLRASEDERRQLGEQLAATMRTLNEGGALDTLTTLQRVLAQEQATLTMLRHRHDAAQAIESAGRQITQDRLALQQEMIADLDERRHAVDEATVLFSDFAGRLYGPDREAYLRFEAARTSLQIETRIDSDASVGIGSMVIFCFDLTVAVLARRAGRCPDFLVHDSHLFDGVDERQLAAALTLAAEIAQQEGLQYLITINSDELAKAQHRGFDPTPYVLPHRLTDQYEAGGLFGFRF